MAFDSGMAKMLMLCFVFIAGFALVVPLIPGEFAVSTKEYSDLSGKVPGYWNGINLMSYNFTGDWNATLTNSAYQWDFDVGGRNLRLEEQVTSIPYDKYLRLTHRYGLGLLWEEDLDWYNQNGELVSYHRYAASVIGYNELNANYEEFDGMDFDTVCLGLGSGSSYFTVTVLFYVNATLYNTPEEAWANSDLDIFVGINQQNSNTALDAWTLISSLMTFNTMEVFGSTGAEVIALNLLIALPIWVAIIIPAAMFTLEALDRILPF